MGLVCAICITWGSLVTQQAEVPTAAKPGFLSRMWDRFGVHRYYCASQLPSPYLLDHPPAWFPDGALAILSAEKGIAPVQESVTPQAAPTLAALTEELESLKKQKVEIERREQEVMEKLKRQYESDRANLEEARKRLVKLGVLRESATWSTYPVSPPSPPPLQDEKRD